MDHNTSTTEPDTDYQSLILEPNFFHNSYLLQIPQPSKQVIPKKPNTCPNQKFVLLLRNLICEQMNCRFERTANLGDPASQTCSQFKFFLNTLEILCHYLNIIKPENYKYRLKDYGAYKVIITILTIHNEKYLETSRRFSTKSRNRSHHHYTNLFIHPSKP